MRGESSEIQSLFHTLHFLDKLLNEFNLAGAKSSKIQFFKQNFQTRLFSNVISKSSPTLEDGGRGAAASLIQSIATNGVYYHFSDNLNCVPNL